MARHRVPPPTSVLFVDPSGAACASAVAAFADGAASVVLASDEHDLVPEALAAVAMGYAVLSTRVHETAACMPDLSGRDRELLTLVATGASNVEISEQLQLSRATVKRDLNRLAAELEVEGRPGLMEAARDMGLGKGSPN
jgi:DNA-binding NarL/FixJ family response regulator